MHCFQFFSPLPHRLPAVNIEQTQHGRPGAHCVDMMVMPRGKLVGFDDVADIELVSGWPVNDAFGVDHHHMHELRGAAPMAAQVQALDHFAQHRLVTSALFHRRFDAIAALSRIFDRKLALGIDAPLALRFRATSIDRDPWTRVGHRVGRTAEQRGKIRLFLVVVPDNQ